MSMISATKWVPRGAAAENPQHADFDEKELQRINELAHLELAEAEEDLNATENSGAKPPLPHEDDDLKEYNMDDYDNEVDEEMQGAVSGVNNLAYYENPDDDEYLTKPTNEELDEEREELKVMPTDNLILSAKTESDVSVLEVSVYDSTSDNLYVHHDIMLPSFPLCLEWLPTKPGTAQKGNFVAIGTFEPEIEIWDLDLVDSMFPTTILGSFDRPEASALGTGKKKKKLKQPNPDYHVDAVLSLSINPQQPNLLASGSADCTIKLWDLSTDKTTAIKSLSNYHKDKVSCVQWNPLESTVLLSGGYDKTAIVGDMRSNNLAKDSRKYKLPSDIESVQWDKNGVNFYVATDSGLIAKFDARESSDPVWMLQAHDSEITSFCVNDFVPGLLATASSDKLVKIWNIDDNKPSMVLSRDFDVGKVFSIQFGPEAESKSLLTIGGSEGHLKVWDAFSNKVVRQTFGVSGEYTAEKIITVNDDDDEEESDREFGDEELN